MNCLPHDCLDFSTHPSRVARMHARKLKGSETFKHANAPPPNAVRPRPHVQSTTVARK